MVYIIYIYICISAPYAMCVSHLGLGNIPFERERREKKKRRKRKKTAALAVTSTRHRE